MKFIGILAYPKITYSIIKEIKKELEYRSLLRFVRKQFYHIALVIGVFIRRLLMDNKCCFVYNAGFDTIGGYPLVKTNVFVYS